MTLGFFCPMPPAMSGVADYGAALYGALGRRISLRLNRDGDVNIYHVGNNQLHAGIYRHALEKPGIVVLHDAVLQHFALGYFDRRAYVSEFIYNYGDWTASLAESLWERRGRSASDDQYFRYPMLKRLAERSLRIVVHNPAAAALVRQHHAGADIVEIPHLLIPHKSSHRADAERLRVKLGGGRIFGAFGHLRESKRILPLLRIFSKKGDCTLLLAGRIASSDLRRACASYAPGPNIKSIGYMSVPEYWNAAAAVDACVNLRYPAAGETSGVTIGMMGIGTPVILSSSQENERYPEGTCIKISTGLREEAELEAVLDWSVRHRSCLREIGLAGAAYVHAEHGIESVIEQYIRALDIH